MSFNYTRSQFKNDINAGIYQKIGMIANENDFVNRVVREVHNIVAFPSMKRKQNLTPDLFEGIYQYACPSDLHDKRIIDIPAQAKRFDDSFGLVPVEQFNVNPQVGDIAIDNYNGVRTLLIKSGVSSENIAVDPLDTVGDWEVYGDGENLTADGTDYIKGNGSLDFGISSAGGTTAGIKNESIDSFDISDFLYGHSALFAWHKITDTTNITSYTLHIGTDTSNYYSKTVTTRHDGNVFENGWNLLRFDLSSLTENGSVTDSNITYVALFMTKSAAKVSETGYKFDNVVIKKGVIHDVLYYSKYGWQSSAAAYKQNSTDDSDLLVADDTEYDILVKWGIKVGRELTKADRADIVAAEDDFNIAVSPFIARNPDESQILVSTYHEQ